MYKERYSWFAVQLQGKKNLVGAEIGVFRGEHAWGLLSHLDIKKLYLIDPYITYPSFFGGDNSIGLKKLNQAQNTAVTIARVYEYNNRIVWYFREAEKVLDDIPDESLDFAYLDGNHIYENVILEIPAWEKKVKIGGLVGGHDYTSKKMGVPKAVNEYTTKYNIKLKIIKTEWFYWRKK